MSESILARVAAGDPAAVRECLGRYRGLVWSLARRLGGNFTDAEDAVQEIFIDVWRFAARFDPAMGSEATYIATIARRRLIDRFRKRSRRLETGPLAPHAEAAIENHDALETQEEAVRVRREMEKLRPEERRVLELSIEGGLSQSEIAEQTDLPLGTVKTHSRRGLLRLRKLLGEE